MAQGPDTIVSGVETIGQLEENVATIKTAKPFTEEEIKSLLSRTAKGPIGPGIEQYKRKEA
jgi:predicted aldo/keto reductase-like oxidoreductase